MMVWFNKIHSGRHPLCSGIELVSIVTDHYVPPMRVATLSLMQKPIYQAVTSDTEIFAIIWSVLSLNRLDSVLSQLYKRNRRTP